MRKIFNLFIFCSISFFSLLNAQNGNITGKVTDPVNKSGIDRVLVILLPSGVETYTDPGGVFTFENIPYGDYTLKIFANTYRVIDKPISVNSNSLNIEEITLEKDLITDVANNDAIVPTVNLSDDESQNSSIGNNNVAGILTASRDVFVSNSSFTFGQARFNYRGYSQGGEYRVFINGIPMNELDNGQVYFNNWGGLNDMFRFGDNSYGLEPTTFSFGEVGGANNIDVIAARQRKQLRVSYSGSNRSYQHRVMATYTTGMLKGGWAFSFSGSWRGSPTSYYPGGFYDSWAYFFSASKKFGKKHLLSFVTFGVPVRRGKTSPTIKEAQDLAGSIYYNPTWGYQEGKVRNANTFSGYQPMYLLTYEWLINEKSSLNISTAFQWGTSGSSRLNWYNAPDPRPDYYRYLPSYQTDSALQQTMIDYYTNNPNALQIDWNHLYQVNYSNQDTIYNADNTPGNTVTGKRSLYVVESYKEDLKEFSFNAYYNASFGNHVHFTAGGLYQMQITRFYRQIDDLLGGDFFFDLNQFAEFDFAGNDTVNQNDLNNLNNVVREGEEYGYNYEMHQHNAQAWVQGRFTFKKVDFFAAAKVDINNYWRNGIYRNGLFPDNSEGESDKLLYVSPFVKAGLTYKLNGRNYFFVNGSWGLRAPSINHVFLNPQTRNTMLDNPSQQTVITAEGGYLLNSPKIKARAVGYISYALDGIKTMTFYHDEYRNFVNLTMQNIDIRSYGGEFALEGEIYRGLGMNGVVAIGRSQYIDRPTATTTLNNTTELLDEDRLVYLNNFNVANGPQWANTIGIFYNSPKYWFVKLNFNYFDWIWMDINPLRRTTLAVEGVEYDSQLYHDIIDQQRLPAIFTMDLFGGYSWKLDNTFKSMKKSMYLNFTASVSNLTNNQFYTSGFEQLRFDFEERNVNKFAPRYFTAYGINFFINVTFRM